MNFAPSTQRSGKSDLLGDDPFVQVGGRASSAGDGVSGRHGDFLDIALDDALHQERSDGLWTHTRIGAQSLLDRARSCWSLAAEKGEIDAHFAGGEDVVNHGGERKGPVVEAPIISGLAVRNLAS